MLRSLLYSAALVGTMASSTAALAGVQDFTAINRSGHTIMTLQVSSSSNPDWGDDLLGSGVLANGRSGEVSFDDDSGDCLWDIRVTYDDGDDSELRQVNLCRVSTVTFNP